MRHKVGNVAKGEGYENCDNRDVGIDGSDDVGSLRYARCSKQSRRESGSHVQKMERGTRWKRVEDFQQMT